MASQLESGELISGEQQRQLYEAEIDSLVRLFNEDEDGVPHVGRRSSDSGAMGRSGQRRKAVAILEGSRLPFSALCKAIFEDLTQVMDPDEIKSGSVTLAGIRTLVLELGQRISFGITGDDTNILEDDSPRCLWRWEARDLRLVPKSSRDQILERRRWGKKIGERVIALSETVQALSIAEAVGNEAERIACLNAKELLMKTDIETVLRARNASKQQDCGSPGVLIREKLNVPHDGPLGDVSNDLAQASSMKRKRRPPEEIEKLRQEKLVKRMKTQNEKEQKEQEKEQKKGQKERMRQQQDEAERKKRLALTKQANFMSRIFGKKSAVSGGEQGQQSETLAASAAPGPENVEFYSESCEPIETVSVAAQIDVELQRCNELNFEALLNSHLKHWGSFRNRDPCKTQRWSARRKPKISVYRELRLQGTTGDPKGCQQDGQQDDNEARRGVDTVSPLKQGRGDLDSCDVESKESAEYSVDSSQEEVKKTSSGKFHNLRKNVKKLLQFEKNHRPPYYGTHSKRSKYIKPRRPFGQDPDLNYAVDSDDEWEEEEPGESLSDTEIEDDDEKLELEAIEEDEDGADDYIVPDGYLSDGEGVIEDSEQEGTQAPSSGLNSSPTTPVQQNVMSLERLRKVLDNATENAIRSNHPLMITNFGPLADQDYHLETPHFPTKRANILCLEALRMRVLVPNVIVSVV